MKRREKYRAARENPIDKDKLLGLGNSNAKMSKQLRRNRREGQLLLTQLNNLTETPQDQTQAKSSPQDAVKNNSMEDDVKNTIVKRLDGIKNRDEAAVRALIDEHYSKFDDWPPFGRQDMTKALENEFGAFKVLSNYSYELKDFEANVFGDAAVATFTIRYQGQIRNRPFDVNSRVTSVLKKQDSGWKVVHEHFSRFPDETRQQYMAPRRMMQP
jgi:ketosteroid isomerase-like protein